jgi:DNA invertase Pin-like site-specific DNA recombinase
MNYVAYYRVSTQQQGRSGLGLEAQRAAVLQHVGQALEPGNEFTEVETGKGSNALDRRPVLKAALAEAKRTKATLIIAKLDRLARNVSFIAQLMESKVKFICADMPEATELTLHIMAAMAQHERQMISERTKAALAAAKARGVKLGNPSLDIDNTKRRVRAQQFADTLAPTLNAWQAQGFTQTRMVEELNRLQIPAAKGGEWSRLQLQRVLGRLS